MVLMFLITYRCSHCNAMWNVIESFTDSGCVVEAKKIKLKCNTCNGLCSVYNIVDLSYAEMFNISKGNRNEFLNVKFFNKEVIRLQPHQLDINVEDLIKQGFNGQVSAYFERGNLFTFNIVPNSKLDASCIVPGFNMTNKIDNRGQRW